ncbi:MAG: hypothetical protein K0S32_1689 [Bacteroidetes bacterium]|jgi:hypothetical protein|nr:hypothetical protein [Bacteroidota bacterium]
MRETLTREEKKFLESLGFKAQYPDERDKKYVQYIKHLEHPVIIDLRIVVDGTIHVWGREHKMGLSKSEYLITHRKFSKDSLMTLMLVLSY